MYENLKKEVTRYSNVDFLLTVEPILNIIVNISTNSETDLLNRSLGIKNKWYPFVYTCKINPLGWFYRTKIFLNWYENLTGFKTTKISELLKAWGNFKRPTLLWPFVSLLFHYVWETPKISVLPFWSDHLPKNLWKKWSVGL